MLRLSPPTLKSLVIPSSLLTFFSSILVYFAFSISPANAQIHYEVEAQAVGTTNKVVPFWMRSNQYGNIPMAGSSASFLARVERDYTSRRDSLSRRAKFWDWGIGFEGRVNTKISESHFVLTEGYLKSHLGRFDLKLGRSKETMGLTGDTVLSAGSFAMAGNTVGVPQIRLSMDDFYALPILGGMFSIKWSFSHGWLGKTPLQYSLTRTRTVKSYFHQKSLYGQIGKKDWRLKLEAGFNHQAFWGGEKAYLGRYFDLSEPESFLLIITGKRYSTPATGSSKLGNHLGSIDLGLQYEFDKLSIKLYRQNFYDVGALYYLANILDGLNGITFINKNESHKNLSLNKILIEFLNTKNQAGETWSRGTPSGDEDYYNNYVYAEGWSYRHVGIGLPFITPRSTAKKGQASHIHQYFINNRVQAIHLGLQASFCGWSAIGKFSYSKNYGTFKTLTIGDPNDPKDTTLPKSKDDTFKPVNQLSVYLDTKKELKKNLSVGGSFAYDYGNLLYSSNGLVLKVIKSF